MISNIVKFSLTQGLEFIWGIFQEKTMAVFYVWLRYHGGNTNLWHRGKLSCQTNSSCPLRLSLPSSSSLQQRDGGLCEHVSEDSVAGTRGRGGGQELAE